MASLKAAELEILYTVNTDQVGKAEKDVKASGERIEKKPITAKVDADAKGALASMDRVEATAKKLVSRDTSLKLDADISRAETNLEKAKQRLADLEVRALGGLDVTADTKRAEANLQRVERNLKALQSARTQIEVEADTSGAEASLEDVKGAAGESGEDAGKEFGDNIVAALVSIPIAGAVIGIGVAAGKALIDGLNDGLQIEVGYDRLQALTGVDEATALRLGRAAGEAYANNFGESIEANMDTTRLALQFDLIDEQGTTRDAQKVVQGLAGIADVLGEDVQAVARTTTTLLRTGLAKSAEEAFDIIAAGAREGVNIGGDLLDTYNEYSTQFRKLGIDGPQSLGLLSQALRGGARDSDVAADALKEFAIRAVDPAMEESFERVGFSWSDLSERISRGGPDAAAALDETLDKLRAIEDPAMRDAAAVELFGTKSEDMAAALYEMDLSNAVDQLDGVTGSAQRMFDTLASNDASKIEQAQRNIEVAVQGIQGTLATAFSEPLGEFADWVSANRGPLMQFLLDLANGALDFAVAATESTGEFVSGPLAELVDGLANVVDIFNWFEGKPQGLVDLAEGMRDFDSTTGDAVAKIEQVRDRVNEYAEPVVALGYLNDKSLELAKSIGDVGTAADGTTVSSEALETQVRNAVTAMQAEIDAAQAAGESQANLEERHKTATDALLGQLQAMGLTEQAARDLIAAGGTVVVNADVSGADREMQGFWDRWNNGEITVEVKSMLSYAVNSGSAGSIPRVPNARGNIIEFMANGGLTPMAPQATMVPANTWRVVGDRTDVSEAYIPMDGSPRSMSLLLEAMRRMGVIPMATGGVTGPAPSTLPSQLKLVVGDREFTAYVRDEAGHVADSRIAGSDADTARVARQGARDW